MTAKQDVHEIWLAKSEPVAHSKLGTVLPSTNLAMWEESLNPDDFVDGNDCSGQGPFTVRSSLYEHRLHYRTVQIEPRPHPVARLKLAALEVRLQKGGLKGVFGKLGVTQEAAQIVEHPDK